MVESVLTGNASVAELIALLKLKDPKLCIQAMNIMYKIAEQNPQLIKPYKKDVLGWIAELKPVQCHWFVARILAVLNLNPSEQDRAVQICQSYLTDSGQNVTTWTLNAIVVIAQTNSKYQTLADQMLSEAMSSHSSALQARARQLISKYFHEALKI